MKKTFKTTAAILVSSFVLAGFTACGKPADKPSDTSTPSSILNTTEESTDAESSVKDDDVKAPDAIFTETELVKIGEHTYYPADLFDGSDRNKKYKDHMISQLQQADKDLHDDIYVHGIGESEVKGEFRFFGKMMKDGVIWETADMTCWYSEENGSAWNIDSKFRRADFNKSGLIKAESVFDKVYETASDPKNVKAMGTNKITGTYLLVADANGTLYYAFTICKHSVVCVDAKTGEIISERYWNGRYT